MNTSQQDFLRAKRNNNRAGLAIFVIFLAWVPTYLLVLRPALNQWLSQYIQSYPAALHLIPIIGGMVLVGWPLAKLYPPPALPGQADAK
jgi:threonine/homoserine/homoserine lactone efflux protein